jgi:hypothetical protein
MDHLVKSYRGTPSSNPNLISQIILNIPVVTCCFVCLFVCKYSCSPTELLVPVNSPNTLDIQIFACYFACLQYPPHRHDYKSMFQNTLLIQFIENIQFPTKTSRHHKEVSSHILLGHWKIRLLFRVRNHRYASIHNPPSKNARL